MNPTKITLDGAEAFERLTEWVGEGEHSPAGDLQLVDMGPPRPGETSAKRFIVTCSHFLEDGQFDPSQVFTVSGPDLSPVLVDLVHKVDAAARDREAAEAAIEATA